MLYLYRPQCAALYQMEGDMLMDLKLLWVVRNLFSLHADMLALLAVLL